MDPAECERKGYKRGENASPHDKRVHQPTGEAPLCDETLLDQVMGSGFCGALRVCKKPLAVAEELAAAPPVESGSRALEPLGVTEGHRSEGDYACYGITEERRIIVLEFA